MAEAGNGNNRLTDGHLLHGILGLAGPMFVSAVLQNVQTLIDLFWVGRLGSRAVAALAISGTTLMLLFPLIIGMAAGTMAMVSRRFGEGDVEAASEAGGQSLALALVFGVATGLTGYVLSRRICVLLGATPQVADLAEAYLQISFLGSFTVFLLFIGNTILQAAGNAVVPMLTMIAANLLNLVLDPILIFGLLGMPRLGIRGAATATVTAQLVTALAVMAVLCSGKLTIHVNLRSWRPRPALAARLLRIGFPGTGQMLSRSLMALVLMRIVSGCGTAAVAAYGVGLRFHMILLMPAFALGNAAGTMVGQNLGAGKPWRAQAAAWLAAAIDAGITIVCAAAIAGWAPGLMRLFAADPEVIATGAAYVRTTSFFYVFVGVAIVLGRALIGAGDTVPPMIFTIISLWGFQVPLALMLSRRFEPPTQGIWWAIACAVTVHGLLVAAWFLLGRWKSRKV